MACTDLTYKCKNNKCISKKNPECDDKPDCDDRSDEENCGMTSKRFCCRAPFRSNWFLSPTRCTTSCDRPAAHPLLSSQTAGRERSSLRVSLADRTPRTGSFRGRSASTSRTGDTCAERPSSARRGSSLPPTACRTKEA